MPSSGLLRIDAFKKIIALEQKVGDGVGRSVIVAHKNDMIHTMAHTVERELSVILRCN